MADLRTRFIEDYAGGLLNVARQELSSTGEVLAQDGFVENITLFVEDGRGVKSGLRLGSSLAECIDPTTDTGILNVRSADRTYAKIRDLKAFATAVASAQSALTESITESFTTLEGAFESLENDVQSYRTQLNELIDTTDLGVSNLSTKTEELGSRILDTNTRISGLEARTVSLETTLSAVQVVTAEVEVSGSTAALPDNEAATINIRGSGYYAVSKIRTNVPAWVTIYANATSRGSDQRISASTPALNSGIVMDVVTTSDDLVHNILPFTIGKGDEGLFYVRAVNKSGSPVSVNVVITYIPL